MDYAGWHIAGGLILLLVGAAIQKYVLASNCETCGMVNLKTEIGRLNDELTDELQRHQLEIKKMCLLVRALAQRSGMTVMEQAELESFESK